MCRSWNLSGLNNLWSWGAWWECVRCGHVHSVKGLSAQYKPGGGNDWDLYVSHLSLDTYTSNFDFERHVAKEINGNHILLILQVNLYPPLLDILSDRGDQVFH